MTVPEPRPMIEPRLTVTPRPSIEPRPMITPHPSIEPRLVPVLHAGVILPGRSDGLEIMVDAAAGQPAPTLTPIAGGFGQVLIDPPPSRDIRLDIRRNGVAVAGSPLGVQVGGWSGAVEWTDGRLVVGRAQNLRHPERDVTVVGFTPAGCLCFATARASEGGRFILLLPANMPGDMPSVSLGIAGSDYLLASGIIARNRAGPTTATPRLHRRPLQPLAIRIKISTPNLKEAPFWGDYHFAHSLRTGFERLGLAAGVDTADVWYQQPEQEDVVLSLRGRHRVNIDPAKINILWLISHPDRIPDAEYADYDHVAVASDVYAAKLRARGLPSVSVLHQATDASLFRHDAAVARKPSCLFVGNSRREYRTMVKWCVESDVPFDLYGGGWEGILPETMVRAPSIANKDLAEYYASHLIVLNDHWDSMRDNGFLSNRLFDASAVGSPILTDPVAGLADVFGDSLSVAGTIEQFAATVTDCLANPAPYLARAQQARQIVMAAHTFDHRARQLADLIDRLAARKLRRG